MIPTFTPSTKLFRRRQRVIAVIPFSEMRAGENGVLADECGLYVLRKEDGVEEPQKNHILDTDVLAVVIDNGGHLPEGSYPLRNYEIGAGYQLNSESPVGILRAAMGSILEIDPDNPSEVNQMEIGLRVMPASDTKVKALQALKALIHTMPVPITPLLGAPRELFEGAPMAVL